MMKSPEMILAANLQRLKDDRQISSEAALARLAKVDQKTVWRVMRGEQSPTVSMLERLAQAFGLHAWQLLIPGLDPKNPPVFVMTDSERDLYSKLARMASEFVASEPKTTYEQ